MATVKETDTVAVPNVVETEEPEKDETEEPKKDETVAEAEDGEEDGDEEKGSDESGSQDSKEEENAEPPSEEESYPPEPTTVEELIPQVRYTTFTQFKNFYEEKDMQYIVQALKAGANLKTQIQKEKNRRGDKEDPSQRKSVVEDSQDMLHRVRIHSPCILEPLHHAAGKTLSDPMRPQTFCRPFKILVNYHPQMREALDRLEAKWSAHVDHGAAEPQAEASSGRTGGEYSDSKYTLLHMREYVKFMEDEVMPLDRQYEPAVPRAVPSRRKILYTDLWYLFREGDYVYSPVPINKKRTADSGPTASNSALQASYQTCWKVYAIITPETPSDPDSTDSSPPREDDGVLKPDDDANDDEGLTRICCYYIDYDGDSYGPVTNQFTIQPFTGERDILSLPVYPTCYHSKEHEYLEGQKQQGQKFTEYVGKKHGEKFNEYARGMHLEHYGWTLTLSPTGNMLDGVDKYPEHIESEVIVDFNEAFQSLTSWKPEIHVPRPAQIGNWRFDSCSDESVLAYRWSKSGENVHMCILLHRSDDISLIRRNQELEKDQFLNELRRDEDVVPSGDHLRLLPRRLVVYSLLERKFINTDVNCLSHLRPQPDIFNKLSINDNHKSILGSLVSEHFRKKQRRKEGKEIIYQDFIRGKGTGLVFLLHGVPGVGKTATAEAIAQENKKPLFAITCGDLGFEPGDVEKNLTRIFRLANLWDCILLLDEADIFFTKRAPTDLQRNALVTVFLRILEYYSGILFLTTNRVGIIDEAFKSRIHMSLYYPPLTDKQYARIFEVNLERIHEIEATNAAAGEQPIGIDDADIRAWAARHYIRTAQFVGRWNGRQIRNAFQIAASLAHYELLDKALKKTQPATPDGKQSQRPVNPRPGYFTSFHLEAIAETTHAFDDYMARARKGDDGFLARMDKARDDRPVPQPTPAQAYGAPPPPPPPPRYGYQNEPQRLNYPPAVQESPYREPYYPPPDRNGGSRYAEPYHDIPPASRWSGQQDSGPSPRPSAALYNAQDSGISLSYGQPPPPSESRYTPDALSGWGNGNGRPAPPDGRDVPTKPPAGPGAEGGYRSGPEQNDPYSSVRPPPGSGPEGAYGPGAGGDYGSRPGGTYGMAGQNDPYSAGKPPAFPGEYDRRY